MLGIGRKPAGYFCACVTVSLLAGCASAREKVDKNMITRDETRQIAEQPLKDFNLTHDEIPPVLQAAVANPYAQPSPYRCDEIGRQVASLNTVLGPDFDTPHDPDSGVTRQKAMEAVSGVASSWIPFRNVVRWVSGADKHSRDLRRAVLAGQVRRAYLKGLREKLRCSTVQVHRSADRRKRH